MNRKNELTIERKLELEEELFDYLSNRKDLSELF